MSLQKQTDLPPLAEEQAIVARIRRGDREAAGVLFQWFADALYRRAILPRLPQREAAEDVLKDTFRIALERIEQFEQHDRSIEATTLPAHRVADQGAPAREPRNPRA